MPDEQRDKRREILQRARQTHGLAKQGLAQLERRDPTLVASGVSNAIVFGRAVTNVLENLRSVATDFDTWYKRYTEEMAQTPLFKRIYKLRSEILKQGKLGTTSRVSITSGSVGDLFRAAGPQPPLPPGARASLFIGDPLGGSGWEIVMSDGTTEKFYTSIPSTVTTSVQIQVDGESVDAIEAVHEYLEYLDAMISDAQKQFG
jgi:hypothetical protein